MLLLVNLCNTFFKSCFRDLKFFVMNSLLYKLFQKSVPDDNCNSLGSKLSLYLKYHMSI